MGEKCPKCDHRRSDEDDAPPGECPKCGVVYAKFEAAQRHSEALRLAEHDAIRLAAQIGHPLPKKAAKRNGLLLAILAFGALLVLTQSSWIKPRLERWYETLTLADSQPHGEVALTVIGLSCQPANQAMMALGEVRNDSRRSLLVEANLTLVDRHRRVASTLHQQATLERQPLAPQETSKFTAVFPLQEKYAGPCRIGSFTDPDGHAIAFKYAPGLALPADDARP